MIHPRRPRVPVATSLITSILDAAIAGAPPAGPLNPDNGHAFACECSGCSLFWSTGRGSRLWTEWCRRTADPL